jgi:glycosyltransferase involved in cell wall biosynthesis
VAGNPDEGRRLRILLIAPSINPVTYKGLGKYCKEILEGMQKHAEVEFVQKISEQDKVISTNSEIPFRLAGRRLVHNYAVVHALSPDMGIYSPIIYSNSVVTFHDLIPILAYREMRFRLSFIMPHYTMLTWRMAARARRIIVNSTQTQNELVHVLGVNPQKIRVIPLGVDDKFNPTLRRHSGRRAIGFFGNYTYRKRVDVAVSAFKLISQKIDADLILAGGEIQTIYQRHFNMQKLIAGVKHVQLLGQVAEGKLPELYNRFDVMLFPSMYEGFGLPILEAQRCGVPVLTLRNARIPDEVKKMTVPCDDTEHMAQIALTLLENDEQREKLAGDAASYVAQFTWDRTVTRTLRVYHELAP